MKKIGFDLSCKSVNLGSDLTIDIWKVFGAWPSVAEAYPSAIVRSAEVQKHRRAKELKSEAPKVRIITIPKKKSTQGEGSC